MIRNLEADDAAEIHRIAEATSGFTPPSPYIVWMLSRTQEPFCKICVNEKGEILGYVFALRTWNDHELFIWQLGIAETQKFRFVRTAKELCSALLEIALEKGIKRAVFTVSEGTRLKFVKRLLDLLGLPVLRATGRRVNVGAGQELEYCLSRKESSHD